MLVVVNFSGMKVCESMVECKTKRMLYTVLWQATCSLQTQDTVPQGPSSVIEECRREYSAALGRCARLSSIGTTHKSNWFRPCKMLSETGTAGGASS
jgi:hypothetical protein